MEPRYQPNKFEEKIYQFWEKKKIFEAKVNSKKRPFSIILPPPNANADLHLGHALYVYEDIMIRYHKLLGDEVLWLVGADHAGFETQYVFEKELKKQGKSRFDFDKETFYQMIWNFVMKNRKNMEKQLKRLGFALDWSKKKFTLDPDVVKIIKETFKKLYDSNLVYKEKAIVNYCIHCGTSFSDLEVTYEEKRGKLWYIFYPFNINNPEKGGITVATTRPETMLGDVAVAVNPKDKRYEKLIGKKVILPLVNKEIEIVGDLVVDPKFGTGAVKVTPYHDPTDFEIAKRQNIHPSLYKQVIGFDGKMTIFAGKDFEGLPIKQARKKVITSLKEKKLITKEEDYVHRVGHCYKCGKVIEPLPMEQWFVKIKPLAKKAKELVQKEKIKVIPKRFKKTLIWWFNNFHDWNISRQIVWGIQIPAYFCNVCQKWFVSVFKPKECPRCNQKNFVQEKDTFDTWFSSGQWPYATLKTLGKETFDFFYPTTVMETGYDILPWWVARMIMLGVFFTGKEPFKTIFLHGLVRDKFGQKMSKSKGNVINPMEMINKYGADALRLALVFEVKEGADQSISEEKIIGMRNFVNKVWNIGRFIYLNLNEPRTNITRKNIKSKNQPQNNKILKKLRAESIKEKKQYHKLMKSYKFSLALTLIHKFLWHRLANVYLEQLKDEIKNGNIKVLEELRRVYLENLIMLHPFAPFVTEVIWKKFSGEEETILKVNIK